MKSLFLNAALVSLLFVSSEPSASAQSISAGTIAGTVHNPVTGFNQSATTDTAGAFHFTNVPLASYHLEVPAHGFAAFA